MSKYDSVTSIKLLLLAFEGFYFHAEFVGHDGVEEDAYDGGYGKTRQVDGTKGNVIVGSVFYSDGQNQYEGGNKHVARTLEVYFLLSFVVFRADERHK